MVKIGTDIVEISRFSEMDNLDLFLKHSFTKREREYFKKFKNPYQSIAGAFAAKEAFSKYIGSGFRGFNLRDIEVLHDGFGKPYIVFMNNPISADVSISHCSVAATAVVCGNEPFFSSDNSEFIKSYLAYLPKRYEDMHKGMCGRVLIVAGSIGMVGAACLSSKAAIRSGSGLVTLATPACVQQTAAAKLDEIMTVPLADKGGLIDEKALCSISESILKSDVCAFGPGLGKSAAILKILEKLLSFKTPMVIDADGLNALSEKPDTLLNKNCDVVITPHIKEMSRLCGLSVEEIGENRIKTAVDFAKKYKVTVLLKGHNTVIASKNGEYHINTTGNNGMATAGSGDVLTGIISSFAGGGVPLYNAAVLGAFIHGLSGDIAAKENGEFGLIAGDIINKIPLAIKAVQGKI